MIARVVNYQVGLCRGRKDSPIRTLDLTVQCSDDPSVQRVFLRFYDNVQASLGFVNTVRDSVFAFLPLDDFDLTRELLRGDDDVFFASIADAEGNLVWTEITTAETPLRAHHVAKSALLHIVAPEEQPPAATSAQAD